MIRMATIILGVFLPFAANAQTVRIGQYLHPKSDMDETFNQLYLAGAKDALFVYNTLSPDKRYCLPQNLALSTEQASDILRRWTKKQTSNIEEALLAQALLYALQETFPCPK